MTRAVACLLAGTFALPAAAGAAEVRVEGDALVYVAAAGEQNRIRIGADPDPGAGPAEFAFSVSDTRIAVAAPCTLLALIVRCPAGQLTVARFDLGDGDDDLAAVSDESFAGRALPLRVAAGAGDDAVVGSRFDDALDGGDGNDDLAGQAGDDTVAGGAGDDRVRGNDGNDALAGGAGDDRLVGGFGDDAISSGAGRDVVGGNEGNDRIDLRNGERDTLDSDAVDCHDDDDTIVLDPRDRILEWPTGRDVRLLRSCETVEGQRAAPKPSRVVVRDGVASVTSKIALPATITVRVLVGGQLAAHGRKTRDGSNTKVALRLIRRSRQPVAATIRVTIRDTSGRTATRTFRARVRI